MDANQARREAVLRYLSLIECSSRNARESLCVGVEASAAAQAGPRLSIANANGNVVNAGNTAQAAAHHARAMEARANAELSNLISFAQALSGVLHSGGSAPPDAGEHQHQN